MNVKPLNQLSTPLDVLMEITPVCNWNCVFCYEYKKTNHPSLEQIKKMVDALAEANVFTVTLFGGEPTSHPKLIEIIDYIREKNIYCELMTNGSLLTKEIVEKMKEVEGGIGISIHSHDPKKHDELTQTPGSWERTMKGIKLSVKKGVETTISFTPTKYNYKDLKKLVEVIPEVDHIVINRFNLSGATREKKYLSLSIKEMNELAEIMHGISQSGKKIYFGDVIPFCSLPKKYHYLVRGCSAGTTMCYITSEGQVKICGMSPFEEGSILEKPLKEIWENKRFKEFREEKYKHETCFKCDDFKACRGGCPFSDPETNHEKFSYDWYITKA